MIVPDRSSESVYRTTLPLRFATMAPSSRRTLRCWLVIERLRPTTWARSLAASVVSRSARTILMRVGSQSPSSSARIRFSLRGVSICCSAVLAAAGSIGLGITFGIGLHGIAWLRGQHPLGGTRPHDEVVMVRLVDHVCGG